jgi:hypothetical protein
MLDVRQRTTDHTARGRLEQVLLINRPRLGQQLAIKPVEFCQLLLDPLTSASSIPTVGRLDPRPVEADFTQPNQAQCHCDGADFPEQSPELNLVCVAEVTQRAVVRLVSFGEPQKVNIPQAHVFQNATGTQPRAVHFWGVESAIGAEDQPVSTITTPRVRTRRMSPQSTIPAMTRGWIGGLPRVAQ